MQNNCDSSKHARSRRGSNKTNNWRHALQGGISFDDFIDCDTGTEDEGNPFLLYMQNTQFNLFKTQSSVVYLCELVWYMSDFFLQM